MGTDIHWIIERKHVDGRWEAIASKDYLWSDVYHTLPTMDFIFDRPAFAFGRRDYGLFGVLSNIRYVPPEQGIVLADEGLPSDPSEHTRMALGPDNRSVHTPGHYTLGQLREVVEFDQDDCAPDPEDKKTIANHLAQLETILRGESDVALDQILVGPEGGDGAPRFPEMREMSNHRRIELQGRAAGFLPIADDTVRVIFAYDN